MTKYQQLLRSLQLEPEETELFHENESVTLHNDPKKPNYSEKSSTSSDKLNNSVFSGQFQSCDEQLHVQASDGIVSIKHIKEHAADDWIDIKDDPAQLNALADSIAKQRVMAQGIIPISYTDVTNCKGCGKVAVPPELANAGNVLGCPWCWHRAAGRPVPRPQMC